MKNTRKTIKYMWLGIKKHKLAFFGTFFIFGLMVFVNTALIPIQVKKLTDFLYAEDINSAYQVIFYLLVFYIFAKVLLFVSMRLLASFESKAMKELHEFSYDNFIKHDYHFYKDQFTGSLVSKMSRLGDNMVSIVDIFIFNFFRPLLLYCLVFIFSQKKVILYLSYS